MEPSLVNAVTAGLAVAIEEGMASNRPAAFGSTAGSPLADHVIGPALSTAGDVLAMGDQTLVQLVSEHGDAVHPGVMPESMTVHHQVRPLLRRVERLRRRSNATNSDPNYQAQCVRLC